VILSSVIDTNKHTLMASIDQIAAFDLVKIKLLYKSPKTIELPSDNLRLSKLSLSHSTFYASINGRNSIVMDLNCGIIKGLTLGPLLYVFTSYPLMTF
jgi:hypothetical protein